VPAYVYGPYPHGMGSHDEYVAIEEFLHVVRTHVLSAYDYLTAATA
jgi:succinyl-diaminopimelate desuccinylase